MAAVLQNNSNRISFRTSGTSQAANDIDQERAAGVAMSVNIDELIKQANMEPLTTNGLYNKYWRSGRVHSVARDMYKAAVMSQNQTLRLFSFTDCGEKPNVTRFSAMLLCSQNGRIVRRCCSTESCQSKHMSQGYPAALGVFNF